MCQKIHDSSNLLLINDLLKFNKHLLKNNFFPIPCFISEKVFIDKSLFFSCNTLEDYGKMPNIFLHKYALYI